ncbi:MAG: DUF262 domain-containing protein [Prevotella sp.]|jgi:hypothetical protein|nr:DUF262 domain-containing protein [Prevotella sp.]MBO5615065.1 DUF262 domain-containing protein [Prevotella sp.]
MDIKLHEISVRDLVRGYKDSAEEGVVAYDGKLDVRPKYQREFVYSGSQRDAVIDTVRKNFPLNVMYWAVNDDGTFEVLDGQQRTISICQYVSGDFSINEKYFHTLADDEQEQILNYKMTIYFCKGTDSEKLAWFKTINIAGEKLSDQELRNAVYTGEWLTDAKKHFSKSGCVAQTIAEKYHSKKVNRQELLELALKWISAKNKISIEQYMADHQKDSNANELWLYFQNVISWVKTIFPKYRREMKVQPWGVMYNNFGDDTSLDTKKINDEIDRLMVDDDVTNRVGIYQYVLDRKENHLQIREFEARDRRAAYERQKGICPGCNKHFEIEDMHADHITPWSKGGKTTADNCQMLCADCNRKKGAK